MNFWDAQRHSIEQCEDVVRLKRAGLTDADVTGLSDTMLALVTAIATRRDAATTSPAKRHAFDLGIQAVQEIGRDGNLVDGAGVISNLLTVAANNGASTDLLFAAQTSQPTTGSFDSTRGDTLIVPALGARLV